tara:strand:- start:68 stop:2146 length:2079 start_codon:yes stop_codon:yes gene_type:complete
MASGTVGYQDTRGDKDWLSQIWDLIQEHSDKLGSEEDSAEKGGAIVAVGSSGITQTNNNVFVKMDSGLGSSFFGKRLDQTTFYPDVLGGEMVRAGGGKSGPGTSTDAINVMATTITDPIVAELNKQNALLWAIGGAIDNQSAITKKAYSDQLEMAAKARADALAANEISDLEGIKNSSGTNPFVDTRGGGSGGGGGGALGALFGTIGALSGMAIRGLATRGLAKVGTRVLGSKVTGSGTKTGLSRVKGFDHIALPGGSKPLVQQGKKNFMSRIGKYLGREGTEKAGKKVLGKGLGKSFGKKIPVLGLGLGALFAAERLARGDWGGALLELASGTASMFPTIGTGLSVGIDGALMARDMASMQNGGIPLGQNFPAILNDRPDMNPEAVMPLTLDTFTMFGEGWLKAMTDNKNKYTELQGDGLSNFWNKKGGFASMSGWFGNLTDGVGNFFGNMGDGLKNWFGETLIPNLQNFWEGTQENLGNVWNTTTDWVGNVWNGLGDTMNNLKQGIVDITGRTVEALSNAYQWVAGGGVQDWARGLTGGEQGDGQFTIGPLNIPNIFHKGDDNTEHVGVSDSNRSVFESLTDGQISRILTSGPGSTVEGVNVTTDLLKQLNQFQNERNLAGSTQAGVTFSQVSEANALANAGNTVTINNIYQTNGENGGSTTEVTPNFSGPTDGHGSFLTAFSSLAIATL